MKLAVIARPVYGARNAFGPLLTSIEEELGDKVETLVVEGNPLREASSYKLRGYTPVILYGVSSPSYLELRSEIREAAGRYIVVAGGPHAEGAYWHLLRDGVWAAVVGDGEAALTSLLQALVRREGPSEAVNVAYRDEDGGFRVSRQVLVRLDDYPPYNVRHQLYPPIEIMRGCIYRCRFCQVPWLFKASVRYRGLESTLEASQRYIEAGYRRIRFVAPIGFAYMSRGPGDVNLDAIEGLLKGVRRLGGVPFLGSFPSEVRPEYVTREVLDLVRRYAGNRRVSLGLQSGSDKLLERVGRGHTVEDTLEAVKLVLDHGLVPVVDLMFSLPGEDEEDVEETVRVMFELAGMGARLRLHTFIPLPGTPLARSKPSPVNERYKKAALKLLGKGVLEGYWREQEQLAPRVYCLTALDPAPTPEPRPLPGSLEYCSRHGLSLPGNTVHIQEPSNSFK
ncbi:MAG: TIGR04013 family B12-binding domain/radical SAM domain-containing protein [Desulfurococcales archaeon]|nr:TIGR04013 family B12-binding domain/radical SAM domain-containing protein [Desulfurococcales archaeon]